MAHSFGLAAIVDAGGGRHALATPQHRDLVGGIFPADRRQDQSGRHGASPRQGRQAARRPHHRETSRSPTSATKPARSSGSRRLKAPLPPSTSCCAAACGRARSAPRRRQRAAARRRAFLRRQRADRRTSARPSLPCAIPAARSTPRRMPASSSSAASRRSPSRGAWTAFPRLLLRPLPADLEHIEPMLSHAVHASCSRRDRLQVFFNGPESFTPDDRYSSARRRSSRISSSPRGSTRSASNPRAAPARCSPSGSPPAIRRWISGTSTSAA